MNLYIIKDVLYDYTSGMCVIAAESLPRAEEVFVEEFAAATSIFTKRFGLRILRTSPAVFLSTL